MNKQSSAILTTKKQVISLPKFLLIVSLFITVGGEFSNNSLHYSESILSHYDFITIPSFALIFYIIGMIIQHR